MSKLSDAIGKSIAAPQGPLDSDTPMDDDEDTESPGAMLAEALGISDADTTKIDAALAAAIRKLS